MARVQTVLKGKKTVMRVFKMKKEHGISVIFALEFVLWQNLMSIIIFRRGIVGFFKHFLLPFWSLLTRYLVTSRQN